MIKVLYVDDEPDLLQVSKVFLEKNGQMQVDTLTSATEALKEDGISPTMRSSPITRCRRWTASRS